MRDCVPFCEVWLSMQPGVPARLLGLVAKALLVAVRLHALFALMLADFRLTTFFETSHGFGILSLG